MALPVFKITDAGIAAANAHAGGPAIFIPKFRIGSGYNYTPVGGDTDIHGTMLYEGAPTALNLVSNQLLDVVCQIPASVGPFNFGEIGIYLDDDTLFALAAYEVLQEKLQQVVNGIANVWVIHCMLHLSPTPNVSFTLQNNSGVILPEVPNTGYVTGPIQMMNDPNAVIVHENTPGSESMYLIKHGDHEWTPVEYYFWKSGTVTSATYDDVTANVFSGIGNYHENALLIQDANGNVRGIKTIANKKATYTHPSIQLTAGSTFKLYKYQSLKDMGLDFTEGNPDAGDTYVVVSPSMIAPSGTGKPLLPTLIASAFATTPAASDTHEATRWQIRGSNSTATIWDSGEITNPSYLTQIATPGTVVLANNTVYTARVQYKGVTSGWSAWSSELQFTTLAVAGTAPVINPPTVDAASNTALTFTMNASPNPMTVANGTDTHISTQFRISTSPGGAGTIFDTNTGGYSALVTGLVNGTTYYAAARYQGQNLGWSAWGTEATFTTLASTSPGSTPPPTSTAYVDAPLISGSPTSNVNPANPYQITFSNAANAVHNSTATVNQTQILIYEGTTLISNTTAGGTSPVSIPSNTMRESASYSIKLRYFTTQSGLSSSESAALNISTQAAVVPPTYNPVVNFSSGSNTYQQGDPVRWWISGAPPGAATVLEPNGNSYPITIDGSGNYYSSVTPRSDATVNTAPNTTSLPAYTYSIHYTGSGQNITKTHTIIIRPCPVTSVAFSQASASPGALISLVITFASSITNDGGATMCPVFNLSGVANITNLVNTPSYSTSDPSYWNKVTGVLTAPVTLANVGSTQDATATITDSAGNIFARRCTITVAAAAHGTFTYSTNTSFTVPAGVTNLTVSGGAGGGSGGPRWLSGGNEYSGGGGAGGEHVENVPLPVAPGDVIDLLIGQGGISGGGNNPGSNGGDTTLKVNTVVRAVLRGGNCGGAAGAGGTPNGTYGSPTAGETVTTTSASFIPTAGNTARPGSPNGGYGNNNVGYNANGGNGYVTISY